MNLVTNKIFELQLAKIESVLILRFRPIFLSVNKPDSSGTIHIVISCVIFKFLTVQERVLEVFKALEEKCADILQEHLVVIQAYDPDEMNDVLLEVFP